MRLLIQFPTRGRPGQALYHLRHYIEMLARPELTMVHVAMDEDDEEMSHPDVKQKVHELLQSRPLAEGYVSFEKNHCKMDAVNRNVTAFDFDIVIVGSDDLLPVEEFYDNIIREEMQEAFPDTDGVLLLFDGTMKGLCTTPCVGRKYFDRFGWVNNPIYKSVFADNDLTETSRRLGKLHEVDRVILRHNHPAHGRGSWDSLYDRNQSYWAEDQAKFEQRKAENFGILDVS